VPEWLPVSRLKPNSTLLDLLCCPLDGTNLFHSDGRLICEVGHAIPVEQGIPVFTEKPRREPKPLNMPSLPPTTVPRPVDAFVDDWIVNTNGNLYWRARGRLSRYPIPRWPSSPSNSANGVRQVLVDLGCSWGRWTVAAARAGFCVCGVDIHLDALWAAARVTRELGLSADFACCDIAHLPFKPQTADFVFSYSVLQHLDKQSVEQVLNGIGRILRPGGTCFIQLPNMFGLVSLWRQARRGFREPAKDTFEMRYWTPAQIARAFRDAGLGNLRFRAEGFLLQNTQSEDLDLLSVPGAVAVLSSCAFRSAANAIPPLCRIADSLWLEARKE
jgi:SAM-dependent methyltransferase/uncharacterized protein YbaR (Trm112 family)